jgi:hypothetical protein
MNERTVFGHEITPQQRVAIVVYGEIDLDVLESIEGFCHRQRVRLTKIMMEKLTGAGDDVAA